MLFRTGAKKKCALLAPASDPVQTAFHEDAKPNQTTEAELRRQMYERMALGSAIEEIEVSARRKWR